MKNTINNIEAIHALEDNAAQKVTAGYNSTDHYSTSTLPTPLICSMCGGYVYTITSNHYGPQRVLKSITYHCSGNGTHPPHDMFVEYM